ncbi:MAG: hypothetical protein BWY73_00634 [candidate division TA06 bacterium ADurb.Bin417]|uniref:Uncharacterized protein n=1 Tax=candidate division TA06 bacterium ADurb.Bin417 TaxID=1852828 RepID=A0A1V5MHS7_UNCT6|nr:MAG: hypothetical protein BWY73_00634 [candidate division TA06 bacterium ADurb.Bin417]
MLHYVTVNTIPLSLQPFDFLANFFNDSPILDDFSLIVRYRNNIKYFSTILRRKFLMGSFLSLEFTDYFRNISVTGGLDLKANMFIVNIYEKINVVSAIPFIRSWFNFHTEFLLQLTIDCLNL